MKRRRDFVSEDHIVKIWAVIIGSGLLALIFPPSGTITFLVIGYWLVLYLASLAKIFLDHASRTAGTSGVVRVNQRDLAIRAGLSENWSSAWLAVCESPAEEAFLRAAIDHFDLSPDDQALAGNGITLDMQRAISSMRVDFLVNEILVVEVDGAAWHSSPKQKQNDADRDQRLFKMGYRVLRIPAKRVFDDPDGAMQDVTDAVFRMTN